MDCVAAGRVPGVVVSGPGECTGEICELDDCCRPAEWTAACTGGEIKQLYARDRDGVSAACIECIQTQRGTPTAIMYCVDPISHTSCSAEEAALDIVDDDPTPETIEQLTGDCLVCVYLADDGHKWDGGGAGWWERWKHHCSGPCEPHGTYVDGACTCDEGYHGPDCKNSIRPIDVLHTLAELDASGACAANGVSLDGVAATAVPCEDLLGVGPCAHLMDIFSCDVDFVAGGSMAGKCDATCHICGASPGSGHRRLADDMGKVLQSLATLAAPRGRRLQTNDCTPGVFAAQAEAVTEACCEAAGDHCGNGVATVCDVRCALVYIEFYESCNGVLASYSAAAAYLSLYTTCHDGLPLKTLLEAADRCEQ
jgi:hypothetical protein